MATLKPEKEPELWSRRFLGYRAKWFLLPIVGIFAFMQAIVHDGGIYGAVERGADANTLNQLYFPQWSFDAGTAILRIMLGVIVALVGVAIFIRYANWHYNNHGIALD